MSPVCQFTKLLCGYFQDFNKVVGLFSQSVFQPKSSKVLTGTSVGNIVVWDVVPSTDLPCDRKAFKIVRLQEKGINVVTLVDRLDQVSKSLIIPCLLVEIDA